MIFTAYFDESGTHGAAPKIVVGGFLGHAYQWRRFETKLTRLQSEYGFKIFHAKEFKAQTGEFKGWSDAKCVRLIDDLTKLVKSNLTMGVIISLDYARYMNEYRAPPIPKKMTLDSQYGACFRGCLNYILRRLEWRGEKNTRLNVVFEDGHKNVGDCQRIFMDLKRRFRSVGSEVLGTFSIGTKEASPPLMVADMLAHTYSMVEIAIQAGTPIAGALQFPVNENGELAILQFKEAAFTELKQGFERLRQMEIAAWREQRKSPPK